MSHNQERVTKEESDIIYRWVKKFIHDNGLTNLFDTLPEVERHGRVLSAVRLW